MFFHHLEIAISFSGKKDVTSSLPLKKKRIAFISNFLVASNKDCPQFFRKLRHSFYIDLHPQLFKKLKVLRSGNLDLTSNSLNCSIWDKRADYFLHWFSPFTYRMVNRLSLANTLSGNDCKLLNDKSLWKDEKKKLS